MLFFRCMVSYNKIKADKFLIVRQLQYNKTGNRYELVKLFIMCKLLSKMNPSNAPPKACMFMFSQSVKPKLRKVRAFKTTTFRSHGIRESAQLVFFT